MEEDSPFASGVEVGVGFSDVALLAVSFLGFVMLATTLYSIMLARWKSMELAGVEQPELDYDEKLDNADVATLNRAQRRARAKNIMKRQRRITPVLGGGAAGEGEAAGDENQEADQINNDRHVVAVANNILEGESDGEDGDRRHLSRKERDKAAKAAEREERKRFDEVRREQQLKAQEEAQREKRERERMEAERQEEKRKLVREQKAAEEQEAYLCWKTFITSGDGKLTLTVNEWINELRQSKSVILSDLAERFQLPHAKMRERIRELQGERRVQGILDGECFIAVTDFELKTIADTINDRGMVSTNDLIEISSTLIERKFIND